MGFTVEQECPQCGAPVEMDESDHLLECPFCSVRFFLFAPNYFRFVLPHKAPGEDLLYAPYLRFSGNVYFCKGHQVGHRVVDITNVGLAFKGLPGTLGLRPQAMKMRFVTPKTGGSFLKFTLKAADIISRAGTLSARGSAGDILHRAYIGESLSLIYLPLYVRKNRLFDAILNRPIADLPEGRERFEPVMVKKPRWEIHFIPTLCPQCGWNLEGQRDSVILTCGNCETAWEASKGKFVPLRASVVPGVGKHTRYLPFWKITAKAQGVKIDSFADFIRLTNQPRVVGEEWEEEDMSFWAPAFKIRPKVFLHLSKQFTVLQEQFQTDEDIHGKDLYPVTLPRTEALQALKVILASSAVHKKNVMPHLPQIRFEVKRASLVFLPFTERGLELIQQQMSISINKNTLEYGRRR